MLFLSGGCCEGSSPLCLHAGELLLGPNDRLLGHVDGIPFYVDADQYRRFGEPKLVLDVADGPSDTLSLEGPDGIHFLARTPPAAACATASAPSS